MKAAERALEGIRERLARIPAATWAAFALFTFTMLFRLMHSPLWGDEWNEWRFSQAPFRGGKFLAAVTDTFQPPLYNVLAHFWLAVSDSLLWFRLLNIPLGWLAAAILYRTVAERNGRPAGAAAVCALALCNQWVWCIQECSEYTLMLLFLFLALRAFVRTWETFSWKSLVLFLAACVGAMYSQYGAVFVVAPFGAALWLRTAAWRRVPFRRAAAVTGAFAFCGAAFGLPLWYWFLRVQMAHNQIAGHAVSFSWELFRGFPFALGEMAGWFFALENLPSWGLAGSIACAALLAAVAVSAFVLRGSAWRALSVCLLATYVLHFVLVRLQIYAMIRPGLSAGFLCRYSFFLLPVLAFWGSAAAADALRGLRRVRSRPLRFAVAAGFAAAALAVAGNSFVHVLRNRHKAWDDEFARIWVENRGWEHRTFLTGFSRPGFLHWVGRRMELTDIPRGTVAYCIKHPLPDAFWIWQANWNPESAFDTLEEAKRRGYEVPVECRHGDNLLVFCRLPAHSDP